MDLFDIFKACFRRWYVVIPILLITAWIAHKNYATVKQVYYSNAVVSVAPPNEQIPYNGDGSPVPLNGLMNAGGPTGLANMAVLAFNSSVTAKVVAAGGAANFTVRMFPSPVIGGGAGTQLPLIMVEATEDDAASATKTVELAAAQVQPVLESLQRQAGVADAQMARAVVVSPASTVAGTPSRGRKFGTIIAVGTCAAILTGVAMDALLLRLRSGRRRPTAAPVQRDHGSGDPDLDASPIDKALARQDATVTSAQDRQ